jgi:hypothetical protein
MLLLTGNFSTSDGIPRNGATVKLWRAQAFATLPPPKDTPLPDTAYLIDTTTTHPSHGSDGSWSFNTSVSGILVVSVEWKGSIVYEARFIPLGGGGTGGVDIRTFGAVGDGTTNDRPAIQTALNTLAASGGDLVIPTGRYGILGQLQVPSNVRLIGQGGATLVSQNAGGTSLVALSGTVTNTTTTLTADALPSGNVLSVTSTSAFTTGDFVLVRDARFMVPATSTGRNQEINRVVAKTGSTLILANNLAWDYLVSQSAEVVKINPCVNARVEGIRIEIPTGRQGAGVRLVLAVDCLVEDVHCRENDGFPAFRIDQSYNCHFVKCSAKDARRQSTSTGIAYGFIINESSLFCSVAHCHTENCREDTITNFSRHCSYVHNTNRDCLINAINTHGSSTYHTLIAHNLIEGQRQYGINVSGGSAQTQDYYVTITDNIIRGCRSSGIVVEGPANQVNEGIVVANNVVRDFGMTDALGAFGIMISQTKNFVVEGNFVDGGTYGGNTGIRVQPASGGIVTNNVVRSVPGYGIRIVNNCKDVLVANNRCENILSNNIQTLGTNHGIVIRNNEADDDNVNFAGGETLFGNSWGGANTLRGDLTGTGGITSTKSLTAASGLQITTGLVKLPSPATITSSGTVSAFQPVERLGNVGGTPITRTLPSAANLPLGTLLCFSRDEGNSLVRIQRAGSDTIAGAHGWYLAEPNATMEIYTISSTTWGFKSKSGVSGSIP